jgi:hypothetical protein
MSLGFTPVAFKIASAIYLLCSAFCMPFFLSFGAAERSGHASADVGATYILALQESGASVLMAESMVRQLEYACGRGGKGKDIAFLLSALRGSRKGR